MRRTGRLPYLGRKIDSPDRTTECANATVVQNAASSTVDSQRHRQTRDQVPAVISSVSAWTTSKY